MSFLLEMWRKDKILIYFLVNLEVYKFPKKINPLQWWETIVLGHKCSTAWLKWCCRGRAVTTPVMTVTAPADSFFYPQILGWCKTGVSNDETVSIVAEMEYGQFTQSTGFWTQVLGKENFLAMPIHASFSSDNISSLIWQHQVKCNKPNE